MRADINITSAEKSYICVTGSALYITAYARVWKRKRVREDDITDYDTTLYYLNRQKAKVIVSSISSGGARSVRKGARFIVICAQEKQENITIYHISRYAREYHICADIIITE